jgi:hypothetical protein
MLVRPGRSLVLVLSTNQEQLWGDAGGRAVKLCRGSALSPKRKGRKQGGSPGRPCAAARWRRLGMVAGASRSVSRRLQIGAAPSRDGAPWLGWRRTSSRIRGEIVAQRLDSGSDHSAFSTALRGATEGDGDEAVASRRDVKKWRWCVGDEVRHVTWWS